MIRVMIADDYKPIRQSIKALLKKAADIKIVGEAEDGQEAVELAKYLVPDILIMDITMPNLNGIQATQQICKLNLDTRIIILSMHSDEVWVRQALQNGARGYVLKYSATKELLAAIRAIHHGEIYLSSAISNILFYEVINVHV